ncbi:MAG TPA: hypothetical protein DDW94_02750 [Deltaproteobacteria bacterium]|nr:hypothetical protein [Deltaproteobacteria bacterium]HCY09695.1 hypothetical protein [Deltaproteobacteria bacterium]
MVKDRLRYTCRQAQGDEVMKRLTLFFILSVILSSCGVIKVAGPDPLSLNEHMRLGAIYESQGKYDLALREYDSAKSIDTKEANVYFAIGNVYLRMKEYPKAEKSYGRAIELREAPEFYNNLGWLLMEKGDMEGARSMVEKAVRMSGEGGYSYLDTLGVIQLRAGEYEAAEGSFLKAADAVPAGRPGALAEIYSHLGELYEKSGKLEKASVIEEKLKAIKAPEWKEGL